MTWFDVAMNFSREVQEAPVAIMLWVNWLSLTACLSILWLPKQPVARVVFLATAANVALMMFVYAHLGMVRALGGVHFVFMGPALVYAWRRLPSLDKDTWHARWVRVFGATWVTSLWIDAVDVARWLGGDTAAGF